MSAGRRSRRQGSCPRRLLQACAGRWCQVPRAGRRPGCVPSPSLGPRAAAHPPPPPLAFLPVTSPRWPHRASSWPRHRGPLPLPWGRPHWGCAATWGAPQGKFVTGVLAPVLPPGVPPAQSLQTHRHASPPITPTPDTALPTTHTTGSSPPPGPTCGHTPTHILQPHLTCADMHHTCVHIARPPACARAQPRREMSTALGNAPPRPGTHTLHDTHVRCSNSFEEGKDLDVYGMSVTSRGRCRWSSWEFRHADAAWGQQGTGSRRCGALWAWWGAPGARAPIGR